MLHILPNTDWTQECSRPAINIISRRLERLFSKIHKKPLLKVYHLFKLQSTCIVDIFYLKYNDIYIYYTMYYYYYVIFT